MFWRLKFEIPITIPIPIPYTHYYTSFLVFYSSIILSYTGLYFAMMKNILITANPVAFIFAIFVCPRLISMQMFYEDKLWNETAATCLYRITPKKKNREICNKCQTVSYLMNVSYFRHRFRIKAVQRILSCTVWQKINDTEGNLWFCWTPAGDVNLCLRWSFLDWRESQFAHLG